MKILVIDGQGGKMGAALTDQIKKNMPDAEVVGRGHEQPCHKRHAARRCGRLPPRRKPRCGKLHVGRRHRGTHRHYFSKRALGRNHAENGGGRFRCVAKKILIPVNRCSVSVVGVQDKTLSEYVRDAVAHAEKPCSEEYCGDRDVL